jgi:hypothetical protein
MAAFQFPWKPPFLSVCLLFFLMPLFCVERNE